MIIKCMHVAFYLLRSVQRLGLNYIIVLTFHLKFVFYGTRDVNLLIKYVKGQLVYVLIFSVN